LGPFVSIELVAHVEKRMRWQYDPPVIPLKIKRKKKKLFFMARLELKYFSTNLNT
jgi:hypothetical protein